MKAQTTTQPAQRVAYITLNKVRYYVTIEGASETLVLEGSETDCYQAIIDNRGTEYARSINATKTLKYQTLNMYNKRIADRAHSLNVRTSKKQLDVLTEIRKMLLTKKDDTKAKRNKSLFRLVRNSPIQGSSARDKFLNVVDAHVKLSGGVCDQIIIDYVNSLK